MIVTYGTYKHHQRFVCELLPMHTSDTLLHDALDLLEHVGIFFIDPVSQVSTIIQDLTFGEKQFTIGGVEVIKLAFCAGLYTFLESFI